ncbi:hypothetical protein [Shinella zoogloeoides]|nr:hypothetical protein [Shinella zoogloeoides]WLR91248.1 hypothetical protein Q9316_12065 [Shinella zoogloeoides]
MKSRFFHPGTLFVAALVFLVLAIPLAQAQLSRQHNEGLHRAFLGRAG